jgi:periplasmic protein TonB
MRAVAAMGSGTYAISFRQSILPWADAPADVARFRRIRNRILIISALLSLLFLLLPKPKQDRTQVAELPPQLAQIVLERETPAPPPPPAPVAVKKQEEQPANANPKKPDDPKPETVKQPVPEARDPKPNKAPGEEGIRRKAAGVGLLAMKDQIAEIRGAPVAVQLNQEIKQGKGVGSGVGAGVGAGNELGVPVRAMITSNATGGSGGINTAAYSRNTGGGGLAGRATTLVEGVAGGGGGGGLGGGGGVKGDGSGAGRGGSLQKGGSGKASRSIEEIKLVFERNKGAIYAIYNRALREDPSLQGKVVVELKIAPSGEVVDVRVLSSELKASELERKLLARIKGFDFGSKDVDVMVVSWPVDFLPS